MTKPEKNKEERYRSYKALAILRAKAALDIFPGERLAIRYKGEPDQDQWLAIKEKP